MVEWLSKHKSISIGGGIAVLTALGQVFSETVKRHPHWAVAFGVIAAGMVIMPLLPSRSKKTRGEGKANTNSVSGDNSGKLINAEHVHYYESGAPQVKEPVTKTTSPPNRRANLVPLRGDFIRTNDSMLPDTPANEYVYVLPIRNEIPLGGETCKADAVCASIDFLWNDLKIGSVERALWLNHEGNEIEISPQVIERIILGKYSEGRWFYYHNPRQFRRHHIRDYHEEDNKAPKVSDIGMNTGPIIMEVRVFNRWKGYQYLRQAFTITPLEDGDSVQIKIIA